MGAGYGVSVASWGRYAVTPRRSVGEFNLASSSDRSRFVGRLGLGWVGVLDI
jgi:hypothetical protein